MADMEPFNPQQHTEKVHEVMHGLEGWLAPFFEHAPHIPEKGRQFIVDIAPWLVLIFGGLSVIGFLGGGMMMGTATLFSGGLALMYVTSFILPFVCSFIATVLMVCAFPGLKEKKKSGWNLVFYSEVVNVAGGMLGVFSGALYLLVSTAIGALIGFWILFEIRSYYK
jgi:hypothetical protein